MGSWSVSCGISNIAITSVHECAIIPLKESTSEYGGYVPCTLPIFGRYNDYGGMEDIIEDDNTKLIESHLGITIADFIKFLVDGKFTYNRREVNKIITKLDENDKYDEVENWRFMWVDKKVYDVMSKCHDQWEIGKHDLGRPEMLSLLGFEPIEGIIENYDQKRYKFKYQKDGVIFYSDGSSLLSHNGQFVYRVAGNDSYCLESYIEVSEEFNFLKEKTSNELWRLQSPELYKKNLGRLFDNKDNSLHDRLSKLWRKHGKEYEIEEVKKPISVQYFDNMEVFGDSIVHLMNVRYNLIPMSGRFYPHVLYLTPQCGEFEQHQILLDEFSRINKSYIEEYD
jgi:hypothetical protein